MLQPLRINPAMSAYEALNGPYDWDQFPLAPPGCKVVTYKVPKSCGSWASHGTDAWYVGPSMDHYQCNHFFVHETRAYRVSGSAKLFSQHCKVPFLMWNKHLQEVIDKLVTTLRELPPTKCQHVISLVHEKLSASPPDAALQTPTHPNHKWLLIFKGCLTSPPPRAKGKTKGGSCQTQDE
jgi:hypothetical protein